MTKLTIAPDKLLSEEQGLDEKATRTTSRGRTAVRLNARLGLSEKAGKPKTGKRVPRQRRRPEEARELIIKAALECFGAFGFEGTSTRAVAERAEVTHTLVLYYFESKDRLFTSTI